MSGIGIGVGVGLRRGGRMTPAGLHAALASIYGAALVGLWIGEDLIVDGSNNVTFWPGRIGGTLAAQTQKATLATLGHRKALTNANAVLANPVALSITLGANILSGAVVCKPSVLPFSAYRCALGVGIFSLVGATGQSALYNQAMTEYVNGAETLTVPNAAAMYELSSASTIGTLFEVAGQTSYGGVRNWLGEVALARALSAQPSAAQRAAEVAALRTYYSLP